MDTGTGSVGGSLGPPPPEGNFFAQAGGVKSVGKPPAPSTWIGGGAEEQIAFALSALLTATKAAAAKLAAANKQNSTFRSFKNCTVIPL